MIGKVITKNNSKKTFSRSERGDFSINKAAKLYLSDGTTYKGRVPAWQKGEYFGEVVFNTGMTGYVESLTDPSYANQILVFTYPLIGNYGVQPDDAESARIQVAGVVVSDVALEGSHEDSVSSFLEWLHSQDIPILVGADTRAITKHLRHQGTMVGAISPKKASLKGVKIKPAQRWSDVAEVYNKGKGKKIILVDCGAKGNILRELLQLKAEIVKVPADYDYTKDSYDAVVLSNGPGDPTDYKATIAIASKALRKDKPVFGICLGSQVMALAAGAKTYKLLFGHRGHNQPCQETKSGRCYITSQNHGYAIDEKSLPRGWEVSFRNLNDKSVEGIAHKSKPYFAVQFHPEAHPGPTDTNWLFEKFEALL